MHVAELVTIRPDPSTVKPRTQHQGVVDARIVFLDSGVDIRRAVRILRIKESADGHHVGVDVLEVRKDVATLPEGVVRVVLHQRIPERDLAVKVLLVCVLERPHIEVELIGVVHAKVESLTPRVRRIGTRSLKEREEPECVLQIERAIVVKVVADEPVGDRRLWRRCLDGRVRVDDRCGRIESGI